jgi:hypothetical protein
MCRCLSGSYLDFSGKAVDLVSANFRSSMGYLVDFCAYMCWSFCLFSTRLYFIKKNIFIGVSCSNFYHSFFWHHLLGRMQIFFDGFRRCGCVGYCLSNVDGLLRALCTVCFFQHLVGRKTLPKETMHDLDNLLSSTPLHLSQLGQLSCPVRTKYLAHLYPNLVLYVPCFFPLIQLAMLSRRLAACLPAVLMAVKLPTLLVIPVSLELKESRSSDKI